MYTLSLFPSRLYMMKRHKKTSICPSQLAGEDDKLSCLINSRVSYIATMSIQYSTLMRFRTETIERINNCRHHATWWSALFFSVSFWLRFFPASSFLWWFTSIYHDGQRKDLTLTTIACDKALSEIHPYTYCFLPSLVSLDTNIDFRTVSKDVEAVFGLRSMHLADSSRQ